MTDAPLQREIKTETICEIAQIAVMGARLRADISLIRRRKHFTKSRRV